MFLVSLFVIFFDFLVSLGLGSRVVFFLLLIGVILLLGGLETCKFGMLLSVLSMFVGGFLVFVVCFFLVVGWVGTCIFGFCLLFLWLDIIEGEGDFLYRLKGVSSMIIVGVFVDWFIFLLRWILGCCTLGVFYWVKSIKLMVIIIFIFKMIVVLIYCDMMYFFFDCIMII